MMTQARTATWSLLAAAALVAGCATNPLSLPPGTPAAELGAKLGEPTAKHTIAGGTRWEYATGPYGKFTWMLDLDASGTLRSSRQVLTEREFNTVRAGTSVAELRTQLGRPSETWRIDWQKQTVWSYRYDTPFCILFHVGIGDDGRVVDTGYGPDWMCEKEPPDGW